MILYKFDMLHKLSIVAFYDSYIYIRTYIYIYMFAVIFSCECQLKKDAGPQRSRIPLSLWCFDQAPGISKPSEWTPCFIHREMN